MLRREGREKELEKREQAKVELWVGAVGDVCRIVFMLKSQEQQVFIVFFRSPKCQSSLFLQIQRYGQS